MPVAAFHLGKLALYYTPAMTNSFDPQPTTLTGRFARLEPLSVRHSTDLFHAGSDEGIWRYMPTAVFRNQEEVHAWIDAALGEVSSGRQVAFAIIDVGTGRAVGSTRYLTIRRENRGLEIGYTWLTPSAQRTPLNTECKLLLLTHAFESLGAMRVEFKTDSRNEKSQRALERIGAVREGVFRRHMILWDGYIRDSVYYSIVDSEWPQTKARLFEKLKG